MSKIEPETWKQRTDSDQRRGGRRIMGKEEEGISQGTCIEDAWAQTTQRRLMVGVGAGDSNREKLGTTVIKQ